MKITKQDRRDAKQLFTSCLSQGLLDENRVRQAVTAVLSQKPRGYVPILTHFQRLVKLDIDRRTALVESATVLTAPEQAAVSSSLTQKYGAGLMLSFSQNPTLLGGLRIKVGSDVYDGSIRARLEQLRDSF